MNIFYFLGVFYAFMAIIFIVWGLIRLDYTKEPSHKLSLYKVTMTVVDKGKYSLEELSNLKGVLFNNGISPNPKRNLTFYIEANSPIQAFMKYSDLFDPVHNYLIDFDISYLSPN